MKPRNELLGSHLANRLGRPGLLDPCHELERHIHSTGRAILVSMLDHHNPGTSTNDAARSYHDGSQIV
ncbi:hypothetical protein [Rhizorhabdus histidinilytica]|uniref:hypothetical protein n=1 Tax=Rhizorhabdus histidinilytica TaxID=439228 RepID=UPI00111640CA|nr:hypothetical protein [Rhizorhabdus histidinilytica]